MGLAQILCKMMIHIEKLISYLYEIYFTVIGNSLMLGFRG
jgi:hypothetical protein